MRKAFHMTTAVAVAVLTLLVAPAASGQALPDPRPPDAFLSSSSGEVKGEYYQYCWAGGNPGICVDRFQVIVPAQAVVVEQGQFLTLRLDPPIRPDSITVSLHGPPDPVPAPPSFPVVFPPLIQRFQVPADTPTRFRADFPPGTYTLFVDARWHPPDRPYGDALYVFKLTVTPAATATVAGAAFYIDGTSNRVGPSGSRVGLFATSAEPGFSYRLVSGTGTAQQPCLNDVVPINDTPRFANAQGVIGQTAGNLNRPPGQWQICFLADGQVVSGAATYTVSA